MSRIPNLLIRRSPSTSSAVPTQVRRSKKGGEDGNVKGYSMNVFTHISNHLLTRHDSTQPTIGHTHFHIHLLSEYHCSFCTEQPALMNSTLFVSPLVNSDQPFP